MKRILSVLGTAILLATAGGGAAVASAPPADATLKGHVRNAAGDPIGHLPITVGYYAKGDTSLDGSYVYSHTDANGRYSVKIPPSTRIEIVFGGASTKKYFVKAKSDFSVKSGSTHRIDRTLVRVSIIAGTVTRGTGSIVHNALVTAFDATTGKRPATSSTALTNDAGHFHLTLPAGSYKLKFAKHQYAHWFGDEKTRETSPTVTVTDGGKTAGINEILAP